ncbi:MAG: hypothetical protein A3A97_02490 [Candidatus Terrybacteria bacterium RIFCSPLOWO2_01_FULL_40_23]|uniref:Uncharacterized protein n=1 Tax=Candidatus Terrybacteria bacterium RIFCSPLOWO2_01_FULL_40_23 TaxID=1802366 RepID=A0A1G2PUK8_9BACT|nr:MAG: hypothetical protein A3A97_02490 [Candidatus Terrybacteria bacterium RIFCSPLOWO2_01_FULL_40_23]
MRISSKLFKFLPLIGAFFFGVGMYFHDLAISHVVEITCLSISVFIALYMGVVIFIQQQKILRVLEEGKRKEI